MEKHFQMFTQLPGLCMIMSHLEDSAHWLLIRGKRQSGYKSDKIWE